MKNESKNWKTDFREFLNSPELRAPSHITEGVLAYVQSDLAPSFSKVVTKLAMAQVLVGAISLLVCAQFGVGRGDFLSGMLMEHFGHMACMTICGSLFLGLPILASVFFLSKPEIRAIRRFAYLPVLTLGVLSLLVFFCLGAELGVAVASVWLLGGVVSGILATEAGICLPRLFAHGLR